MIQRSLLLFALSPFACWPPQAGHHDPDERFMALSDLKQAMDDFDGKVCSVKISFILFVIYFFLACMRIESKITWVRPMHDVPGRPDDANLDP